MTDKNAYEAFIESEKGILNIIRALDLYATHVLAKIRGEDCPEDTVTAIMSGHKISALNLSIISLTDDEKRIIRKEGYFVEVGEQIVVATQAAFENYLISKLGEYYRFHLRYCEELVAKASEEKLLSGLNALSRIKIAYKSILGIHLPSFEIEFEFNPESNFCPSSSWGAICLIDKQRHAVVHCNSERPFRIETLMDSWFAFDFIRMWVSQFNAYFDHQIYEGGWFKGGKINGYMEKAEGLGISLLTPFSIRGKEHE